MHCLVIYDIPNDRARQRVADACLDYGLQRIQYSAFAGNLSRAHQRALFGEITRRLKCHTANVLLFVFDAKTWSERRTLEQQYDDA
jgi:CRISPR-associated protein Cas2